MVKEKKDRKVSIRMSNEDFKYLTYVAYMAGLPLSMYIRSICDSAINGFKLALLKGDVKLEDFEKIFYKGV